MATLASHPHRSLTLHLITKIRRDSIHRKGIKSFPQIAPSTMSLKIDKIKTIISSDFWKSLSYIISWFMRHFTDANGNIKQIWKSSVVGNFMQLLHPDLSLSGDLTIIVQIHPLHQHILQSLQRQASLQICHLLLLFQVYRRGTKVEGMLDGLVRNAFWFFRTKCHLFCSVKIELLDLPVPVLAWIPRILLHDRFDNWFNRKQIQQLRF